MGGEKAPDLLLAGALGNRPLSGVVVMEIKSTEPSRTVLKTGRWAPSQAQTAPFLPSWGPTAPHRGGCADPPTLEEQSSSRYTSEKHNLPC